MKPFALLLLFPVLASAAEAPGSSGRSFEEGEHYVRLPVPVETNTPDAVQVTELFSYGCVHCYRFEPEIEAWRAEQGEQGEGVVFERVPAVFNDSWELLARAYYAADACGVLEQTHTPLFEAIHRDGRRFRDAESLAAFFAERVSGDAEAGCTSASDFAEVFESFGVRSSVQQAMARSRAYRATGVPTMIVDGRWRVDGRMVGSNAAMLDVVDYLVARARGEEREAAQGAPAGGVASGAGGA